MKVTIIGFGMGKKEYCLPMAQKAIDSAQLIIGAPRLLDGLNISAPRGVAATRAEEIKSLIEASHAKCVCVLMSGDSGFYSGTKKLLPLLKDYDLTVLPGISSVQQFAAELQISWQGWHFCTAHGVGCNAAFEVANNAESFFLTGGEQSPTALCSQLLQCGFGELQAAVGSDLGSEQQKIVKGSVAELAEKDFSPLSVLLVKNPAPHRRVSFGLSDEDFVRGNIPMTKSEVRAVVLSKLRLRSDDVVLDIGAGTGSVAVEAALLLTKGMVYAIEQKAEGCRLITDNANRLGAYNLTCVEGKAPDVLHDLPRPDAAFIGGSGGRLRYILLLLLKKNPDVRVVITAVTLETISEAVQLLKELSISNAEVVQLSVSRAQLLGEYHLMTAQNPIYIISGGGGIA